MRARAGVAAALPPTRRGAGHRNGEQMSTDPIRVVHAADIHLDSPMRGLGALDRDLAGALRLSTRRAFDALVQHCLDTLPAVLLIAGDMYDGDWKDSATRAHFAARMRDLTDAGVHVVVGRGNHDAESVIRRAVTLPPKVRVLNAEAPETITLDDVGLAVHGQSFATRAVVANLAQAYPDPVRGLSNVGVLHTSVGGYASHASYAPCDLSDLTGRGYDYFALGHVHAREILASGAHTVAFSGNLQGRHVRETGAKGAWSVTLREGSPAELEFVALDVARWEVVDVCADGLADMEQLLGAVSDALDTAAAESGSRPLVARVQVSGHGAFTCEPERLDAEVRAVAARRNIGVNKVSADLHADPARTALPAHQRRQLAEAIAGADPADLLRDADLAALLSELGQDSRRPAGLDLRDSATLEELLAEAAGELQARADGGVL